MNINNRFQTIFFTTAFLVTLFVSLLIFWPYIISLAITGMVAVLIYPVYKRILAWVKSENISAGMVVLLLVVLVGIPVVFLGNQIINEAEGVYKNLSSGGAVSVDFLTQKVDTYVQKYSPGFKVNVREYLTLFLSWVVDKMGGIFTGTLDIVIKIILSLIALFYFLRDGKYFKERILTLSPLPDDTDNSLIDSLKSAVRSILFGTVIVAMIQGILTGLGFIIFGIQNFALWGSVAAVAALIPGFGTAIVWVPAVIYLYFYGSSGLWIGLLLWSVFLVAFIDNFLSPFLINKGMQVHPLLILFSILGGVQFFGPEGVLIGPLVLSILFALIRITEQKKP